MHKSKLLYLLGGLTKKEIRELEQFIDSPAFNKDDTVKPLYQQVIRYAPEFDSNRLKKENMANRLYGNDKAATLKKLAYTMSNFTKLVEKFILWKQVEKEEDDRDFLYLKAYKERNLDRSFFKTGEVFNKRLDDLPYRDMEYFHLKYRLNLMISFHPGVQKVGTNIPSVKGTLENLDFFIVSAKLFQFLVMRNREISFSEEYQYVLKNEIIELSKISPFSSTTVINIFEGLLSGGWDIPEKRKASFFRLKNLFFDNHTFLRKSELNLIASQLNDFANKIYQSGVDFEEEIFEITKFYMGNRILYFDEHLHPIGYYNAVQIGCELEKFDWVENFISIYSKEILPEEKKNMNLLCNAYLFCCKKEYDKVLILIRDLEFHHHFYDIVAKYLITRCYYEMNEEELLFSYLNSFEAFVRRHTQMSEPRKNRLVNFIKLIRKLSKNRIEKKFTKNELLKMMREKKEISFKSWVIKSINESHI